uniref:Oxpecker n=3 Tax=Drosophila melanogaster TaxID=7227 RepID=A1ZAW9_DROME|nr:oxpecker [Drosophila melanogaster]AAF57821.1 oxpecker [Drosophila melanogaster]|eukprot:NP_611240.1 oxpecker [Drosophila melanogaster]
MSQKSIDLGLGVRNVKEKSSEYIVEKFLGKRYLRGRPQYLTKWEGYPIEQCTWEPLENLGKCMTLIADYEAELFQQSREKKNDQ